MQKKLYKLTISLDFRKPEILNYNAALPRKHEATKQERRKFGITCNSMTLRFRNKDNLKIKPGKRLCRRGSAFRSRSDFNLDLVFKCTLQPLREIVTAVNPKHRRSRNFYEFVIIFYFKKQRVITFILSDFGF